MEYAKHADLVEAVNAGTLTAFNASHIAFNRKLAAEEMEGDFERVYRTERRVGSNRLNVKGFGHKTLGAKNHGKAAMPVRGSGYGNARCERLYRRTATA